MYIYTHTHYIISWYYIYGTQRYLKNTSFTRLKRHMVLVIISVHSLHTELCIFILNYEKKRWKNLTRMTKRWPKWLISLITITLIRWEWWVSDSWNCVSHWSHISPSSQLNKRRVSTLTRMTGTICDFKKQNECEISDLKQNSSLIWDLEEIKSVSG